MNFCQSCGLPLDEDHKELIAKEQDGSDSKYCTYCYKDGAFINPDLTLDEMVEIGMPHLSQKIGEQAAKSQLKQFLPTLERWK